MGFNSGLKGLIYSSDKYLNLSPLVYTLALYSSWESEYSNFLTVLDMWPFATSLISVCYCCSCIRPIVYAPYVKEIDDKNGQQCCFVTGIPCVQIETGFERLNLVHNYFIKVYITGLLFNFYF